MKFGGEAADAWRLLPVQMTLLVLVCVFRRGAVWFRGVEAWLTRVVDGGGSHGLWFHVGDEREVEGDDDVSGCHWFSLF